MLYGLWTTCIIIEFFNYFWSAWLNHLLLPSMSEIHPASGACLQVCVHLGLRHTEPCNSSQSDLALCAVVMWANSAMRSPQIHRSLFLTACYRPVINREKGHYDSLYKLFCSLWKTVCRDKKTLMIPQLHRGKQKPTTRYKFGCHLFQITMLLKQSRQGSICHW